MTVPFSSVPSNLRVPIFAVEFDSSRSQQGPAVLAYRALLIGQKLSGGTAAANSLHRVTSADAVVPLAGRGSLLHRQALAWFANNRFTETWIGVLEDNAAGVAATGTLTVTGPATADGTLYLYIGGTRLTVAVANADTATEIAAAIVAEITAETDLPVTAAVGGGGSEHIVTLTARNKGTNGNFDVRLNYQYGEETPAGVGVAIVEMASGATDPVLGTLIAAMGDQWFNVIAHPYSDSTSLTALETELSSRADPLRMIDGVALTSANGSQSTLSTLGDTRNSQFSCIVAQPGDNPLAPPAEFAAAVAGVVAFNAPIDPARPLQTLTVKGLLPPADADLFTLEERNLLLYDGVATTCVTAGQMQLERVITTYQTNAAGSADTAYLDVTTVFTLMFLRYDFRTYMHGKFPRHKLANDGTRVGPGQYVLTPLGVKAEAVAWFRRMEDLGLVENFDQFKNDLVVERNASDPTRLDFLLPPDLVNPFIVGAANIQFRL